MNIQIIQDKYNTVKQWLVKKTPCGHYYYSQTIYGQRLYPYSRTTKKFLISAGIIG